MEKEVERSSFQPNLASVQESPAYDSISIRAIKKDFVKEQRKQFENESDSSADNVQTSVPLCKNEDMAAKNRSSFALKTWQSLQGDYSGSNIKMSPNNSKPLPVSPLNRSSGGRKSLSTQMEMRMSAFERTGANNSVSPESPVKPVFRPKPEHLSNKSPGKSPIISPVPSRNAPELSALSSPSHRHCLKGNNDGVVQNVSQELESKSFIPRSCSKEAAVLRHFRSPETEKQLSNHKAKGFSNIGNNQGIRTDHVGGRSLAIIGMNLDVVSPVNSGHGLVKSVLPPPPPTPPRISAGITPTSVPRPPSVGFSPASVPKPPSAGFSPASVPKPPETVRDGTDGPLRGTVSNLKTPESKVKQEADCIRLTPSSGQNTSAAKRDPLKTPAKFSADRSKIDEWWESKFIRTSQPRTPRTKETHHIRRINNPCYMYAKISQPDDVIVGQPLVRHHSDEVLDSTPAFKLRGKNKCITHYDDGPVYHSPIDLAFQKQRRLETVMFDKNGYAVPSSIREPQMKNGIGEFTRAEVDSAGRTAHSKHHESSYVKSKVSNAYAVLRLPMFPGSHGHTERAEEGDYDIDVEEHKKLLRHVSNVKYKTDEAIAKYERVRLASTNRLFQYAMIIGLCDDGRGNNTPKITFCFPKDMMISEKQTSYFCFPDADDLKPSADYNGEMFSFVLTNATGDRRYGLCKRYLPPGSGARLPEALCVVSAIGDSAFYGRLLDAVKESRFVETKYAEEMLQMAYAKPFPQPNHEVYLRTVGPNNKRKPLILKRILDSRSQTVDFSLLLHLLDISTLIRVFSAILLERKIIFIANQLSTLSLCICAIVSLLYPFEWQHTFVTILPSNLTDVIQAPTPYILGLLSSSVSKFSDVIKELDEVLVIDLDNDTLLKSEGDEGRIIPKKLQKALTVALADDQGDGQNSCLVKGQGMRDATVAEAFLRLFVETCGHYTEYMCRQPDGEIVFQRELFVKAVHSRSIRLFLEWFTQTQMFSIFVTGRLKGDIKRGYFEERILEYRQEMEETTSTLENMKAIGKKIADFFQKSGDKLRKTFQKAVYV